MRYNANVGEVNAAYLATTSIRRGMRAEEHVTNHGGGTVSFDAQALADFKTRRAGWDGRVTQDRNGLTIWFAGEPFPVRDAEEISRASQ